MVELVDTVVLEATASASEFESRLGHQFRSVSVHGRTLACHAKRRGSLPLWTAKFTRLVKWYNKRLISVNQRIDTSTGYQNPVTTFVKVAFD